MHPENRGSLQQANAARELVAQLLPAWILIRLLPAAGRHATRPVASPKADCNNSPCPCSPACFQLQIVLHGAVFVCYRYPKGLYASLHPGPRRGSGRAGTPCPSCTACCCQHLSLLLLLPSLNAFDYSVSLDLMSHRHFMEKKQKNKKICSIASSSCVSGLQKTNKHRWKMHSA